MNLISLRKNHREAVNHFSLKNFGNGYSVIQTTQSNIFGDINPDKIILLV